MLFHLLFTIKLLKKCYIVVNIICFIEDYKKKDMKLMRKPFPQCSQLGVVAILNVGSKAERFCRISTKITVNLLEIIYLLLSSNFWICVAKNLSKKCCKSFNT